MSLPLKKTITIGASLFIATFVYLYNTPDNTRNAVILEPRSEITNAPKSATPSVATTTDLITSSSKSPQIRKEARHSQTLDSPAKPHSYTYDDLMANSDEVAAPGEIDTEEIDAHWAFEKENYYINLFSDVESLAGFVLSEAQCADLQCKLSFLLEDDSQKDDITNKLVERLMSESQELSVAFDLNTPSGAAVLYISDKK